MQVRRAVTKSSCLLKSSCRCEQSVSACWLLHDCANVHSHANSVRMLTGCRSRIQHISRSNGPRSQASSSEDVTKGKQFASRSSSTLALLDMILGVAQQQHQEQYGQLADHQTNTAPLQQAARSFGSNVPLQGDPTEAAGVLSRSDIWSHAWSCLETAQSPVPLPLATPKPVPRGNRFHRFRPFRSTQQRGQTVQNGQQQKQQDMQQLQFRHRDAPSSPIKQAQLHLQGLQVKARLQLIALSLAALERQVASLSTACVR